MKPEHFFAPNEIPLYRLTIWERVKRGFDWRAFLVRYTTPLTFLFAVVATGIVIASKVMP